MAVTPPITALGCGRHIDEVWDHLGSAPDAHERTCPYCRAARADLADLGQATRAMRDDNATNPDLQPSSGVLDRILTVARAEVRRGRRLPLDQPRSDQTSSNTVSEQTVNAVIRRVGDRTSHVQIRRCSVTTDDTGSRAAEPVGGGSATAPPSAAAVAVSLRVSVARQLSIVQVGQRLRADIIDAVRDEVGIDVTRVDINVEDLHDV